MRHRSASERSSVTSRRRRGEAGGRSVVIEAAAPVEFDGVFKAFGDTVVLRDFNFAVSAGERVALIGPSGSGKTTILRMLMTLERPDRGRIRVGTEYLWHVEQDGRL